MVKRRFPTKNPLVLLVVAASFVSPAFADVGSKPRTAEQSPSLQARDVEGITVAMASEEVELTLHPDHLDVKATFNMVNRGPATSFEEGFPVGWYPEAMQGFSVVVDGKKPDVELVDVLAGKGIPGEGKQRINGEDTKDYWYVWKTTYAEKQKRKIEVTYTLKKAMFYSMAGYILHTGAGWSGKIGEAKIALRTAGGLTLDHINSWSPREGAVVSEKEMVWRFRDFEPTAADDIQIRFDPEETWHERTKRIENGYVFPRREIYLLDVYECRDRSRYWEIASRLPIKPDDGGNYALPPCKDGDDNGYAYKVALTQLFLAAVNNVGKEKDAARFVIASRPIIEAILAGKAGRHRYDEYEKDVEQRVREALKKADAALNDRKLRQ